MVLLPRDVRMLQHAAELLRSEHPDMAGRLNCLANVINAEVSVAVNRGIGPW